MFDFSKSSLSGEGISVELKATKQKQQNLVAFARANATDVLLPSCERPFAAPFRGKIELARRLTGVANNKYVYLNP